MLNKKIFIFLYIPLSFAPSCSLAEDVCQNAFKDVPIQSKIADAGFFANLRGKEGSVSVESTALLTHAEELLSSQQPPDVKCPKGCSRNNTPVIYFQSIPQKFLDDSSDAEYCQSLENATKLQPIRYSKSDIKSVKELNDWIGELSQGKGKEGGDLYKKCDKSCSPQYEYEIIRTSPTENTKSAKASIICGAARDKDDDKYKLTAFFRWNCTPT